MSNIRLVVPALNPDVKLKEVVSQLSPLPVLVVNDGSKKECDVFFEELKELPHVEVIAHAVNLGKGAALKTAFNHILVNNPETQSVITFDADGQHKPEDIKKLVEQASKTPEQFILGSRNFKGQGIPLRSQFGNILTQKLFRFFVGQKIQDTQTGLRAIPAASMRSALQIKSNGYDFEFDMLVSSAHDGIQLKEITIETVYIDDNASSHFRPLLDSIAIYFVFIRFLFSSLATTLTDNLIFIPVYYISGNLFAAIASGRVVATGVSFYLNRQIVFHSQGKALYQLCKFVALVCFMVFASYPLTKVLINQGFPAVPSKIVVELFLFIFSFAVQRVFVFPNKNWQ